MAVKLISGRKIQIPPIKEPSQERSFIPETLKQVATGIAGAPGNIIGGWNKLIAGAGEKLTGVPSESFLQTQQQLPTTESLRQDLGVATPEGFIQEALDLTAQNLPLTVLLPGGSLASKVIADLGSSAAMSGAKQAGLDGPVSQFVAGALGGKATSKAFSKLTGGAPISTLSTLAKDAQVKLEEDALKYGTPINVKADRYKKSLESLESKVRDTTTLKAADKKDFLEKLDTLISDTNSGKINASKLLERKRELNAVWPQYAGRENQSPRKFLGQIQKSILQESEDISKTSKEAKNWYDSFKASDDITKALNYQNTLSNLIEEVPQLGKVLKSGLAKGALGLGTGTYLGGLPGAAAGAGAAYVGGKGLRKAEQLYGFLQQGTTTRELLKKAILQSSERQIPQLAKTLTQLNKEAEKFEKKHPIKEESSKVKLISGKKLA